jgi:rRNA maturation endonuclease Nob1
MITDFGRNSFVTHTTGLKERIKKMPDPAYICLSCSKTFVEDDTYCCTNCGELLCPKCGGEIQTIQKYDEAMKANE